MLLSKNFKCLFVWNRSELFKKPHFRPLRKPKNRILPRGSLIIFDEIQFCSRARQAIKQLTDDGRYRFIETGSAVSIELNSLDILLPSQERQVVFAPLDFEEFPINIGMSNVADSIKTAAQAKNYQLFSINHDYCMRLFRTYMLIGGMPEAVRLMLKPVLTGRSLRAKR